jgi:hypothetical protein
MTLSLKNLSPEESSEFNQLITEYGLKIFILNSLENDLTKLRSELLEIEEKLTNFNSDIVCKR